MSLGVPFDRPYRRAVVRRSFEGTAPPFPSGCHPRRLEPSAALVTSASMRRFGGAPAVWAMFGALVAPSGRAKWLRLTQFLALLHYASGLALVAATTGLGELARLERALRLAPEFIVTWATVYLIGQAV